MKKTEIALFCSSVIASLPVLAEMNDSIDSSSTSIGEIIVSDRSFSQQIGTQKITDKQIANMPTRNGNITELLKTNPNVQFSSSSNNSNNGGEIRPDEVSFHGEKFYNNNFIVDGMSNNDNMNPGANNTDRYNSGANAYGLPEGGTQSMWIDSSLVKSVEVFDSNVRAEYGNFTGGVVDAKLKDPDLEKSSGKVFFRTTRDTWASFHIPDEKREQYEKANVLDQQPKFNKYIYGFNVNQPLSDKASMLFSYSKTMSDIDFYHSTLSNVDAKGVRVGGSLYEPQRRTNETFLLRGIYLPDNGDLWRMTAIYSPHTSRLLRTNIKNSAYTTTGGGIQATLEWEKQFEALKMTSYLGYKKTGDEVENIENDYRRYIWTPSFDYRNGNYAPTGGYGRVKNEKEIYTLKQKFEMAEFDLWEMQHKLNFGWQLDFAKAKYQRYTDSANYLYKAANVNCNGADECIEGEQYAYDRSRYRPRKVTANDTDISAYIEDFIKWKQLEVTAGLRLNYNKFLGNTNLANRFSVAYDLFGDHKTKLFGGLNRYYSGSMLAYKLRQGIGENERSTRTITNGVLGDWSTPRSGAGSVPTHYMNNKTKTPYSDEIVAGISHQALSGNWTFKWVNRKSRDGLTQTSRNVDGRVYRTLANYGSTDNDTFTFEFSPTKPIEFKYAVFNWKAALRRSVTKSNNKSYDASATDETEKAIYQNKLMDKSELPSNDFNSPWGAVLTLDTYFPAIRLNWSQDIVFNEGRNYREVNESKVDCSLSSKRAICGDYYGDAVEYKDGKKGSEFSLDWRFKYTQPTYQKQFLEITLDINNVLNRRSLAKSSGSSVVYKMGRNFWLGASYNW